MNVKQSVPVRAPRKNAYAPIEPKLWVIHGQYYDLSSFVDSHPGGSEMLNLGRGRDCTEMFESVHALSKRNVHALLAKYKVDTPEGAPPPPPEMFSWEKDGFYSVLTKRVREHFEKAGKDHKATPLYWLKIVTFFVIWASLITYTYSTGNLVTALLAGFVMNMMGFCIMHDGSHYGISSKPWVNRTLHTLWNNWNLWSHFIWLRHHTYGHHSYTGIFRRDPDLANGQIFYRKHPENAFKPQHKHQWWFTCILLSVLPNQHVGQALLYIRSWIVKHVFGVPMEPISALDLLVSVSLYVPSIFFHFVLPCQLLPISSVLPLVALYWTGQGIGYAASVIPNHDTYETHLLASPLTTGLRDWGEQQILGSGNHTTEDGLWSVIVTSLWGGMNFQIEHHLFPSVSHVHHREVSKIVRQTCSEFGLPYTTQSWFYALWSFLKLMSHLSEPSTYRPADAPPPKQRKQD